MSAHTNNQTDEDFEQPQTQPNLLLTTETSNIDNRPEIPESVRRIHDLLVRSFGATALSYIELDEDLRGRDGIGGTGGIGGIGGRNDIENNHVGSEELTIDQIKVPLWKHQYDCLCDMDRFERNKVVGVSSNYKIWNRMGFNTNPSKFGKTLVVLALASETKKRYQSHSKTVVREKINVSANGLLLSSYKTRLPMIEATLVLVSPAAIDGWIKELTEKTELRWIALTKAAEVDQFGRSETRMYDVVLVIPSVWNRLCANTKDEGWIRFVYDEPVYNKVNQMRWCNADFYWFFTTDPEKMRAQYWNARKTMMQDICGSSSIMENTNDYDNICIKNNFTLDFSEPCRVIHQCRQQLYRLLEGVVNPWVHQIVEAADFPMAVLELTGKSAASSTQSINMIDVVYQHLCKKVDKINLRLKDSGDKDVEQALLRLEKGELTAQLLRLKHRTERLLTESCPICMDTFKQPLIERHCQHIFCRSCLLACLPKCPICRAELDATSDLSEIIPILIPESVDLNIDPQLSDSSLDSYSDFTLRNVINPTPESLVLEILKSKLNIEISSITPTKRKIIIYSSYRVSVKSLSKILDDENIPFRSLSGQISALKKTKALLVSGEIQVLLVGNAPESIGADFSFATDIIFYHKMSTYLQDRLINNSMYGRRTEQLYVHYLER